MKRILFLLAFLFSMQAQAATSGIAMRTETSATAAPVMEATAIETATHASFKERVAYSLVKKAMKKAAKRQPMMGFEDIIVLAGAIVVIIGIITIISAPIHGIIVALLGLLVYLLGKSAGGSLNNIF